MADPVDVVNVADTQRSSTGIGSNPAESVRALGPRNADASSGGVGNHVLTDADYSGIWPNFFFIKPAFAQNPVVHSRDTGQWLSRD